MSTPVDLQALLANLRPKPRGTSYPSADEIDDMQNPASLGTDRASSGLSATFIASTSPPPDIPGSSTIQIQGLSSPSPDPRLENNTTAQNLLSLLKFEKSGSIKDNEISRAAQVKQPASDYLKRERDTTQGPTVSASDLVAKFMNSSTSPPVQPAFQSQGDATDDGGGGGKNEKNGNALQNASQEALLRLLNRSHSSGGRSGSPGFAGPTAQSMSQVRSHHGFSHGADQAKSIPPAFASSERRASPIRLFGTSESKETTPFEPPKLENIATKKENKPLFTYSNPFEILNASRDQTPKLQQTAAQPGTANGNSVLQNSQNSSATERKKSPESASIPKSSRRKLTPRVPIRSSIPTLHGTSVSSDMRKDSYEMPQNEDMAAKSIEPHPALEASGDEMLEKATEGAWETTMVETKQSPDSELGKQPQKSDEQDHKANSAEPADAWESAEDSTAKEAPSRIVPVYNFPIKPFVSITLQMLDGSKVGIREDGVMEISRLKKEFDQLDRSLASATSKYITYSLVKNGGLRIIRQDDGSDRQIFKNSYDRIFNVALCTTSLSSPATDEQAVLGTGVSGSVYYATISKDGNDLFEKNMLESESLIFPPFPIGDENTSGGVLKTRAKRSSRHPMFFAIGRGKSIHLIWPATAMSPRYGVSDSNRRVDVEKLFKERSLKITTGKAGKDFVFSEDDSLIASLDKAGRLRFWDIRPLVNEANATAAKVSPIDIDVPLLTLSTASVAEKSWPTSVLFVDKIRPYAKGGALRYILVGLKQNHTLQLWDIALGKAVQELNFPHETETDGICSVSYHPNSGIIVVGHPTRNAIYFVHLSAPRYTLPPMSQATYIHRIASKDPDIPKPDSTACMSGIREISFAEKGHLRSVELLPIYKSPDAPKDGVETPTLFELYVVHSRGVTCLNISKEDLGWNSESKVINPVNAAQEGLISLKDLKLGGFIDEAAEIKSQSEEAQQPAKATKRKAAKKTTSHSEDVNDVVQHANQGPQIQKAPAQAATNESNSAEVGTGETPATKESKRNKKKSSMPFSEKPIRETNNPKPLPGRVSPLKQAPSEQLRSQEGKPKTEEMESAESFPRSDLNFNESEPVGKVDAVTVGISGGWLDKELKKIENRVSSEFRKELNNLYVNIQNDRNVQDAAAVTRQEAVLRLVSTMLSTNIEKSLSRMISTQMQQVVVPAITGVTVQAVTAQVGDAMARILHQLIPHELGTQLPVAINVALQNPQFSRTVSETVSQKVSALVESHMADLLRTSIAPSFRSLAVSVAERASADAENRVLGQVRQLETHRRTDSAKIDRLNQVLHGMAETLQAMSDSQVAFQDQILKEKRQLAQLSETGSSGASRQPPPLPKPQSPVVPPVAVKTKSNEDAELEYIGQLMDDGLYEQASIKWLQSNQPVDLFDNLFVRFTPDYLAVDVSPLVAFSIAITVGNNLSTNTARRLEWIDAAFGAVDVRDSEIKDLSQHAPALINSLIQKLEDLYMQTLAQDSNDRILPRIAPIVQKARDMKAALLSSDQAHISNAGYEYGQLDA